jgi:hypothetical protein
LSNLKAEQSGAYQCFARNDFGAVYKSARIEVTERTDPDKEGFRSPDVQDIQPDVIRECADCANPPLGQVSDPALPRILLGPSNTSAPEGSPLLLPCSSAPGFETQWLHNDLPVAYTTNLNLDYRLTLLGNGTLRIKELVPSDAGRYSCIVSADGAFDMAHAFINVLTGYLTC